MNYYAPQSLNYYQMTDTFLGTENENGKAEKAVLRRVDIHEASSAKTQYVIKQGN
jgi:hypothetical protein